MAKTFIKDKVFILALTILGIAIIAKIAKSITDGYDLELSWIMEGCIFLLICGVIKYVYDLLGSFKS